MCKVPTLKPKERKKREESFQTAGPKLFNCLPKSIRNLKRIGVEEFKEQLDQFLSTVPDEPKIGGAMPLNCQKSNSVIHQVARGEWKIVDPAGDNLLPVLTEEGRLLIRPLVDGAGSPSLGH